MPTTSTPRSAVSAVSVQHAVKVHGSGSTAVRALDDVSLDLAPGAMTAILGPSGSGKSTLLHCMAGLDLLDEGRVVLDGHDLATLSDRERTELRRTRVGFVFQAFNLLPTLTARQNILLPLTLAGRRPDPVWFDELVSVVGLHDRLEHRPAQLSGGQVQRVAVARALVSRPAVVFADEPTGNLDSRSSAEVLTFLQRAARELGQTVALVTHDATAAGYADEALFLADGRLVDRISAPSAGSVSARMADLSPALAGV